jgi:hypothetical protein
VDREKVDKLSTTNSSKTYKLMGADKRLYESSTPGTLGGHRKGKIYGRLDCPSALRAIAKGGYVANRVFFADEETAISAGFRPCGICMREKYIIWKSQQK